MSYARLCALIDGSTLISLNSSLIVYYVAFKMLKIVTFSCNVVHKPICFTTGDVEIRFMKVYRGYVKENLLTSLNGARQASRHVIELVCFSD